jgi:tetratricopeptide (TPR) repeat protein
MPGRFSNLEFEQQPTESALGAALRQDVTGADHLHAAEAQAQWGRWEPALRLYTRALQADRTLVPAWVGQVQMLVQLGEYHEARVWSDKALDLFRSNGELLAAKAQALARLGSLAPALECSDAALEARGSSPWRWIARGEVLLARRQKYVDECFRKAVLEPAATWFDHVLIAGIYLHYQRVTNALLHLKEALLLEPTHGYIWFERGNCERALSLAPAVSYQRCLEFAPDFGPALQALDELSRPSVGAWLKGLLRRWRSR